MVFKGLGALLRALQELSVELKRPGFEKSEAVVYLRNNVRRLLATERSSQC